MTQLLVLNLFTNLVDPNVHGISKFLNFTSDVCIPFLVLRFHTLEIPFEFLINTFNSSLHQPDLVIELRHFLHAPWAFVDSSELIHLLFHRIHLPFNFFLPLPEFLIVIFIVFERSSSIFVVFNWFRICRKSPFISSTVAVSMVCTLVSNARILASQPRILDVTSSICMPGADVLADVDFSFRIIIFLMILEIMVSMSPIRNTVS